MNTEQFSQINFARVKAAVAKFSPDPVPPSTHSLVDFHRVSAAVAKLTPSSHRKLLGPRGRGSSKHLTPVDAGRRTTMKAKGDDHLFVGMLSGGVMCHD